VVKGNGSKHVIYGQDVLSRKSIGVNELESLDSMKFQEALSPIIEPKFTYDKSIERELKNIRGYMERVERKLKETKECIEKTEIILNALEEKNEEEESVGASMNIISRRGTYYWRICFIF